MLCVILMIMHGDAAPDNIRLTLVCFRKGNAIVHDVWTLKGEILVKKNLLLILCLWFASSLCHTLATGQNVSKSGTTAAVFLEIPVGARAMGMGGAFVGTANDVTSLYWNTAGIARLPRNEALFAHNEWLADTKFDYAALAVPLEDFGTLGLSFTSLSMDDMLVRTVEKPDGTGERFSAGSFAVGLHYARNLSEKFSIGFTAKYISERM